MGRPVEFLDHASESDEVPAVTRVLRSWAPPHELRQKVGQKIRIARKDVTDLDAIGLK
jgi:hypothetical protein